MQLIIILICAWVCGIMPIRNDIDSYSQLLTEIDNDNRYRLES